MAALQLWRKLHPRSKSRVFRFRQDFIFNVSIVTDVLYRKVIRVKALRTRSVSNLKSEMEKYTEVKEAILDNEDSFNVKTLTSVEDLFLHRVHFGHKAGCWNPLMLPFIHGTRAGVHIINLDKTYDCMVRALNVVAHVAYRKGIILFVNERSQFERITEAAATQCGEYFVTGDWRPGTLTNSFKLLGTVRVPDLVLFLSTPTSETAIKEAFMCAIPSVAILDTDCSTRYITYPVPGNDDTPITMQFYLNTFSKAIINAKKQREIDND